MDLYSILQEVKEFGIECVQKKREECLLVTDSVILVYLKTLMSEKEFQIILRYKELVIDVFRRSVKEELDFLDNKP
jgi:hypothetical protein